MNTLQFFHLHHNRLHFEQSGIQDHIEDLNIEQMRCCLHGLNSIAWLLWHLARCEDIGINRLLSNRTQVFDEEDWPKRLNVFRRDIGTGMTMEEVTELSSQIDIKSLRKYSITVACRTQMVIRDVNTEDLYKILEPSYLHQVLYNERALCQNSEWVAEFFFGKTKGWFLGHLGLTHSRGHLGQILIIRKLQGLGSSSR